MFENQFESRKAGILVTAPGESRYWRRKCSGQAGSFLAFPLGLAGEMEGGPDVVLTVLIITKG